MTTQTEAERLADAIDPLVRQSAPDHLTSGVAAAELRRLVSFNQQLMDEVARLQKRDWVRLTDEEIDAAWPSPKGTNSVRMVARIIEAKLKEKNYG